MIKVRKFEAVHGGCLEDWLEYAQITFGSLLEIALEKFSLSLNAAIFSHL